MHYRLAQGLLLLTPLLSPGPATASPNEAGGPVAVVALAHEGEQESLARAAAALQHHLKRSSLQVLGAGKLVRLLSAGVRAAAGAESLSRLSGLFQQGYIQSYSFEYRKALSSLRLVLAGLPATPPGPERWALWVKTKIFEGISLYELGRKSEALDTFLQVLHTRPLMKLSRRQYAPKIVGLWKRARARLEKLSRGKLVADSEPAGARVLVDGVEMGITPYIGRLPHGRYHLRLEKEDVGFANRLVEVGPETVTVRVQLSFEGALDFDQEHPCIRLPPGRESLPEHWWPWLGDRLGVRRLVAVRRLQKEDKAYLAAALVDLVSGKPLREAWMEWPASGRRTLMDATGELAGFLATGKPAQGIEVKQGGSQAAAAVQEQQSARGEPLAPPAPDRPWWRKFWPWGLMVGAGAVLAVGGHIASSHYHDIAYQTGVTAVQNERLAKYRAWLGVAITADILAAAALTTGLIMYYTYREPGCEPSTSPSGDTVSLGILPGGGLLLVGGRF